MQGPLRNQAGGVFCCLVQAFPRMAQAHFAMCKEKPEGPFHLPLGLLCSLRQSITHTMSSHPLGRARPSVGLQRSGLVHMWKTLFPSLRVLVKVPHLITDPPQSPTSPPLPGKA